MLIDCATAHLLNSPHQYATIIFVSTRPPVTPIPKVQNTWQTYEHCGWGTRREFFFNMTRWRRCLPLSVQVFSLIKRSSNSWKSPHPGNLSSPRAKIRLYFRHSFLKSFGSYFQPPAWILRCNFESFMVFSLTCFQTTCGDSFENLNLSVNTPLI